MGDAMCGGCASYPAEERTVAHIAAWLRELTSVDSYITTALSDVADSIESGAWRGKEAT
jgi:hypothetical protein